MITSQYKKTDIGQLLDHVQWVRENTTAEKIVPCLLDRISLSPIGRILRRRWLWSICQNWTTWARD